MTFKRSKSPIQVALLKNTLNKLKEISDDLLKSGEPLLNTRLRALLVDIAIILDNIPEVNS